MRLILLGFAMLLLAGVTLSAGTAPLGRLALGAGLPGLAARLFEDPGWRGTALYRARDFDAAAVAFAAAGRAQTYNLGNSHVRRGAFAAALEAYDLALAQGEDSAARVNFDLVLAVYAGTKIDADSIARWGEKKGDVTTAGDVAKGSARASGTGDEVTNTGATVGLPALQSARQEGVRKVFDDKFVIASDRWLATLEDVPGAFLAARISQEYKRRVKAGTAQPEAETPW